MRKGFPMSDLYKFVILASPTSSVQIAMFREHGEGFEQEPLKLNQSLTFDQATGQVTLTTRRTSYIEIKTFDPTADPADDSSLYLRSGERFTDLSGNAIGEPEDELDDDKIDDDQDGDGSLDDDLRGTGGADERHGGGGDDRVDGLDGDDRLHGEEGDDSLRGGLGADELFGDSGFDALYGDDGADSLWGGTGGDILEGGAGDDLAHGEGGADVLTGGAGRDRILGDSGRDSLDGGADDDIVQGGDDHDRLHGGSGRDNLDGGAGNDRLDGGTQGDRLRGGSGRDSFIGGLGADRFVFDDRDFSGATALTGDRIIDFHRQENDRINLAPVDANTRVAGDQTFTFLGSAAFGKKAGELRVEKGSGFCTIFGDQNGDGAADFAIRVDGVATLAAGDFLL